MWMCSKCTAHLQRNFYGVTEFVLDITKSPLYQKRMGLSPSPSEPKPESPDSKPDPSPSPSPVVPPVRADTNRMEEAELPIPVKRLRWWLCC